MDNSAQICAGIDGMQYSDAVYSGNSRQSSMNSADTVEMQNINSFFHNGIFLWPESTPDKDAQVQLEKEPEDLKWSQFLDGAFPMSAATQSQSQPLHWDVKTESPSGFGDLVTWHQIQQQLPSSDIYKIERRLYKTEKRSDISIRKVPRWKQQLINYYKRED
ncbi:hypothetical protein BHM03_00051137 [Ensete ventricosum]|nr:hypothetical protein BHM03_00051137 [Ensete ventricosum]